MARPPHNPTKAQRRKVSICAGGGMSHEKIAIAIGIDRGTLEKHYAWELSEGAYQRRAEVVAAMHKAALKGNVAAQKAFLSLDPQLADPDPKPEPLGKKEQRNEDAKTAHRGTDWEGDLDPRGNSTLQ